MDGIREVLETHREAMNRRDLDAAVACYADDAVVEFPQNPPVEGRAAIRAVFAEMFRSWHETTTFARVVVEGETAAVEGTSRGRYVSPISSVGGRRVAVPLGRRYEHRFAMFVEVRGGKIARHRVYFDTKELVSQVLGRAD